MTTALDVFTSTRRVGAEYDIPDDEYHAEKALSQTLIKTAKDSMKSFKTMLDEPFVPSRAMDIGTVVHSMVLGTPPCWEEVPFTDYRKTEARAARDEVAARGLIPVKPGEIEAYTTCAEAVLADRNARTYFEAPGWSEVTMWGRDPFTGLQIPMKGRADRITEGGTFVDLKTAANARYFPFRKKIVDLGYDIQRQTYKMLAEQCHLPFIEWKWIVVETSAPYNVGIYEIDIDWQTIADANLAETISRIAYHIEKDYWPSYDGGVMTHPYIKEMK